MWNSTGRSGIGETNQGGTYADLEGLTPNGRQYRNEATLETRDLSGADYWHLRKQLTPEQSIPESMRAVNDTMNLAHCLPNGNANLLAYADPVAAPRQVSKVSLRDRILPQFKRVQTLTAQLVELEKGYKAGEYSLKEYSTLRAVLVTKRNRSQVLYERAISVKEPSYNDLEEDAATYATKGAYTSNKTAYSCGESGAKNDEELSDTPLWLSSISDKNTFKKDRKSVV